MNPTLKRHLYSAGTTFLTGFVIGILPFLNHLDWENLGQSAVFALFLAGLRAGVKLVVEKLILPAVEPVTPEVTEG